MPLLVLGLDGVNWDILKPLLKDLPNLSRLINEGASSTLITTIPPSTGPAWASFATGKNPGKHGVVDFFENPSDSNSRIVTSRTIKSPRIWEMMPDKKCLIINMPFTYPLTEINGIMVSSFFTPPGEPFAPPGVLEELKEIGYKPGVEFEKYGGTEEKAAAHRHDIYKDQFYITKKRVEAFKRLYKKDKWDFLFMLFKGTDIMHHYFIDDHEKLLEYYKLVDKSIKEILDLFEGPIDVLILSDHGGHKANTRTFYVNSWLKKKGFIKESRKIALLKKGKKVKDLLSKLGISLVKDLKKTKKASLMSKVVRKATEGSPIILSSWGLYINEPDSEKLKAVQKEIKEELKELVDDKGDKVFKYVFMREEIYYGEKLSLAPHVVYVPFENYEVNSSYLSGKANKLFVDKVPFLSGEHNSAVKGIFIAHGPSIDKTTINNVSILDLAPTILHFFNCPIPEDIDGEVLKDIFKKNSDPSKREVILGKIDSKKDLQNAISKIKL